MNVVVIGLGSMGRRRVRLVKQYIEKEKKKDWLIAGVDSQIEKCELAKKECQIETYADLSLALNANKFDAAIVSTSPLSHNEIISECLNCGLHVFTEINLVADGYDTNINLAKKNEKQLFLSSTPMYRREMEYIINLAKKNNTGMYHYHIGQYLPEWHPWESYNNFFVGDRRTNGCREIFAIELPWLTEAFGEIVELNCVHKKNSDLKINYDDSYIVQLTHASGTIGVLMVDVVTPRAGREFEYYGENFYCEWKGVPSSLKLFDKESRELFTVNLYSDYEHLDGYNSFVVENAYYDEISNFFNVINKSEQPKYSFEKDYKILKIIDKIEA